MQTPPSRQADQPGKMIEYDHPASPQIGQWLRRNVIAHNEKDGRCYKLVVNHYSINRKPQGSVDKIPIPDDDSTSIDTLVSQVVQIAQDDANSLHSGIQLYAVHAYFANNPDYAPRCFFRVAAEEDLDPDTSVGDPSEPATEKGLVSQAWRHIEAIMRSSVVQTAHLVQTLQQENASQRELIAKQFGQSIEAMALIQEAMDNSTQRRIDEKNAQLKQDTLAGVFEHLKLILPVVLNKIAGQKIVPETDPSFMQLAALFEGMPKEQQEAFVTKFLNPAQAVVFSEFLATYEKRKGQLTSKDNPGPMLNLPALFDDRKERADQDPDPIDSRLTRMETHAKSFKETFSNFSPFKGAIRPATDKKP